MNKKYFTLLKLFFSLLLVSLLVYHSDPKLIVKLVASSRMGYLLFSFALVWLIVIIGIYRWSLFLNQFGNDKKCELIKLSLLSQFCNVFIPGGFWGDLIRGLRIKNQNITLSQGMATVFMDRVLGVWGFVFIGMVLLPFGFAKKNNLFFIILFLLLFLLMFFLFLSLVSKRIQNVVFRLFSLKRKWVKKAMQFYADVGLMISKNRWVILSAFLVSVTAGVINIFVFYLISQALGSTIALFDFFLYIPIIIVISHIPISFQGLGIREAGFVFLFANAGLNRSQSLSISLLYFGILLIIAALSGMIYFIWNQFDKKPTTI